MFLVFNCCYDLSHLQSLQPPDPWPEIQENSGPTATMKTYPFVSPRVGSWGGSESVAGDQPGFPVTRHSFPGWPLGCPQITTLNIKATCTLAAPFWEGWSVCGWLATSFVHYLIHAYWLGLQHCFFNPQTLVWNWEGPSFLLQPGGKGGLSIVLVIMPQGGLCLTLSSRGYSGHLARGLMKTWSNNMLCWVLLWGKHMIWVCNFRESENMHTKK